MLYRSETEEASSSDSSETWSWLPGPLTAYTDSIIKRGITSYYRLAAQETTGNVSAVSRISAVVSLPPDTTAPPAPAQINLFAVDGRVFLQWAASPALDLATYLVFREDHEVHRSQVPRGQVPSPTTTFIDDEVIIGQTYFYHLVAVDATGNKSPSSEVVQATLYPAPDHTPPDPPAIPSAELTRGILTLNWVANAEPDLSDYLVLKSEDSLSRLPDSLGWVPQTSFSDSTGNMSGLSGTVHIAVPLPLDTVPPVVQIISELTPVQVGESHRITVKAYDDRALQSVKMVYRAINTAVTSDTLSMKQQADSTYQAILPGSAMAVPGVEMTVMAYDEAGNSTKTNKQIIPVTEPIHAISLFQNAPNPFNPSTNISFALPQPAHVVLEVYNMLGQVVKTLINEPRPAGRQSARWHGKNNTGEPIASGLYIYRLQIETTVFSRKMVLLR